MFGPAGRAYIYRAYGMHWCANVVTGRQDDPQAVLLRGLDPLMGEQEIGAASGAIRSIGVGARTSLPGPRHRGRAVRPRSFLSSPRAVSGMDRSGFRSGSIRTNRGAGRIRLAAPFLREGQPGRVQVATWT